MDIFAYLKISLGDLIRWIGAGVVTAITYFLGGADKWIYALSAVVILDYVSGVIAAIINHED